MKKKKTNTTWLRAHRQILGYDPDYRHRNKLTNIVWSKDELATVLSQALEITGPFLFSKTYPTAPNFVLEVDGLGVIGLPFSVRDAAAINAQAEQAPYGEADKIVVDNSVQDMLEIDATHVRFENAGWKAFMDTTVREVC
ncbi:hypothetical protein BN946_scf185013.g87 [Trametes cinnabarina]|uniref:Uncharacterized protein n=1 Tax=Pycnoporus cinnabarinus TaxID=5643 RepID=A0A060SG07_PYCCI|nr:hypothetical protein BN946_scf185013.g87 [Trametes cinnabarina]